MKFIKYLKCIFVMILLFIITGCKVVHSHNYIDGKCKCGSIDQNYIDLIKYKEESKQFINNYFICLSEEEYTTENWELIKFITNEYVNKIYKQETKNEIELIIKNYKEQIKLIPQRLIILETSELYPNITLSCFPIDSVINSNEQLEVTIVYGIPLKSFEEIYGLENIKGKIKLYYGILKEKKDYDGETYFDSKEIEEYIIQEIPDLSLLSPQMIEKIVIDNKVFSQEIGYVGILVELNISHENTSHIELNTLVIYYEHYNDKIILYGSMQDFMEGLLETYGNK